MHTDSCCAAGWSLLIPWWLASASTDSPKYIQLGGTPATSEIGVPPLLASCLVAAAPQAIASLLREAKNDPVTCGVTMCSECHAPGHGWAWFFRLQNGHFTVNGFDAKLSFWCIISYKMEILYTLYFQGKSALWSHLIQFQDREEKQEHLAESPGESSLVWLFLQNWLNWTMWRINTI